MSYMKRLAVVIASSRSIQLQSIAFSRRTTASSPSASFSSSFKFPSVFSSIPSVRHTSSTSNSQPSSDPQGAPFPGNANKHPDLSVEEEKMEEEKVQQQLEQQKQSALSSISNKSSPKSRRAQAREEADKDLHISGFTPSPVYIRYATKGEQMAAKKSSAQKRAEVMEVMRNAPPLPEYNVEEVLEELQGLSVREEEEEAAEKERQKKDGTKRTASARPKASRFADDEEASIEFEASKRLSSLGRTALDNPRFHGIHRAIHQWLYDWRHEDGRVGGRPHGGVMRLPGRGFYVRVRGLKQHGVPRRNFDCRTIKDRWFLEGILEKDELKLLPSPYVKGMPIDIVRIPVIYKAKAIHECLIASHAWKSHVSSNFGLMRNSRYEITFEDGTKALTVQLNRPKGLTFALVDDDDSSRQMLSSRIFFATVTGDPLYNDISGLRVVSRKVKLSENMGESEGQEEAEAEEAEKAEKEAAAEEEEVEEEEEETQEGETAAEREWRRKYSRGYWNSILYPLPRNYRICHMTRIASDCRAKTLRVAPVIEDSELVQRLVDQGLPKVLFSPAPSQAEVQQYIKEFYIALRSTASRVTGWEQPFAEQAVKEYAQVEDELLNNIGNHKYL